MLKLTDPHNASVAADPRAALAEAIDLARRGSRTNAESILRHLIEHQPSVEAWNELGSICRAGGRLAEARRCYEHALTLANDDGRIMSNLAGVLSMLGRTPEAVDLLARAVAAEPDDPAVRSNYLMHLHYAAALDPAVLLAEHRKANRCYPTAPRPPVNRPDPDRPLRVGFIGPDFRQHSVAFFFESLLDAPDPQAAHVTIYADVPAPDDTSRRLAAKTDAWCDIDRLDDDQAAQRIRDDDIDVLIDIAGHTRGNRLGVLARRPAPLQGTYLGYPDTTGLDAVDFRISDALADPPGNDDACSERLLRLDGCFLCYRPPQLAPPTEAALPSDSAGQVTFGAFCTQQKINGNVLALWAAVLEAVPDSRLLLKLRGQPEDDLDHIFARKLHDLGIDPQRLTVATSCSYADHLALHRFVDVMLDTYPYNGTTSTCEALYMGVPVVSLVGTHHASRVGLSLLTAAGLDILAATAPQEYLTLAVSMARNGDARRLLRQNLRQQMHANGLCDPPRYAASFHAALRTAWKGLLAEQ